MNGSPTRRIPGAATPGPSKIDADEAAIRFQHTSGRDTEAAYVDAYAPSLSLRWLEDHGMTHQERRCEQWVLSVPRPATFAELVELGVVDVDDLVVPLSAIELGGGS